MAVKEAYFSLTLPSLFLRLLGFKPTPPPDEASRVEDKGDLYETASPTQHIENETDFTLASIFRFKPPKPASQLIRDKIKHVYQELLKKPYNKCRHAVLKMISQYLQTELKVDSSDLRQILYPWHYHPEIPNNAVDAVITGWQHKGFKGPVRNPAQGDLQRAQDIIDAHIAAKLPVPVYVSHAGGKHVVLVTDKITLKDGRTAYLFTDPATRDPDKSSGTLVLTDEISFRRRGKTRTLKIGNFARIKPENRGKKIRGTANQDYYFIGVYSYIDRYNEITGQNAQIADVTSRPDAQDKI